MTSWTEHNHRHEGLLRVFGRWDLTGQAVNIMVGSSVFVLPGLVVQSVGNWAPLSVIVAALGILCVVCSTAEAAGRYRAPGGLYRYIGDAFGEFAGIQMALLYWVVRATASAAVANVFVTHLALFWPAASTPEWRFLVLTLLLLAGGWINVCGTRQTASIVNILCVSKLLPLVVLSIVALPAINWDNLTVHPPADTCAFARATLLWVFAFGGFEATLIPAGEARNPVRDGPRALLYALAIVAVVYTSIQLVVAGLLPGAPSARPVAEAAGVIAGRMGSAIVAISVLIATSGHIGGSILASSRITFAMAARGGLPAAFARIGQRFRTPDVSIVLVTFLIWVFAVTGSFEINATISAVARLLVYAATAVAVLRLRRDGPSAFVVPAWVHVLSAAFCLLLLSLQTAADFLAVFAVLAAAAAISAGYQFWRRAQTVKGAKAVTPE